MWTGIALLCLGSIRGFDILASSVNVPTQPNLALETFVLGLGITAALLAAMHLLHVPRTLWRASSMERLAFCCWGY